MISSAIDKIKQIGYNRCDKCPAFWASTDYWGEGDAGCSLNRDIEEFCSISFLPKFAVKALIKREDKRVDEHYAQLGDEMEKQEFEAECIRNALLKSLESNNLEICWDGKKVEIDYQFSHELLKEFKNLNDRKGIESNE